MRGISLFSFRKRANECLISEKRVFTHFGLGSIMCITIKMTHIIVIPIKIGFDRSSDESLVSQLTWYHHMVFSVGDIRLKSSNNLSLR